MSEKKPLAELGTLEINLGIYHIVLIGRDGAIVIHKVFKDSELTRSLDLAILNNRKISLQNISFEIPDS